MLSCSPHRPNHLGQLAIYLHNNNSSTIFLLLTTIGITYLLYTHPFYIQREISSSIKCDFHCFVCSERELALKIRINLASAFIISLASFKIISLSNAITCALFTYNKWPKDHKPLIFVCSAADFSFVCLFLLIPILG